MQNNKEKKSVIIKKIVRNGPIFIALLIFILTSLIWVNDVQEKQNVLIHQTENLKDELSFHIYNQINNRINLVYLLTAQWNSTPNIDDLLNKSRYDAFVPTYYNFYPGILAINWIDNNGTIQWVYPFETNQRVINQSIIYLADGQLNAAFNIANQSKSFTTTPVTTMYQGGKGFATYMPIMYNGTQAGFFNMAFRTDEIFPSIFANLPILEDYSFKLKENNTLIYHHNENFTESNSHTLCSNITIANKIWTLYVCPIQELQDRVTYWYHIDFLFMGFLLTIIAVVFAVLLRKQFFETEKLYQEKAAAESSLIQSQKLDALGTLAGGIAHDMNNILMGLQSSLFFIENRTDLDENTLKSNQDAIDDMNKLLIRGIELMRQILEFSRKTEQKLETIEFNEILNASIKIFRNSIDKRIKIDCQIPQEKYFIKGNIARLHQIILNLLINSRDAMPNGGNIFISLYKNPEFKISNYQKEPNMFILFPALNDTNKTPNKENFDSMVFLDIRDTGMGIPIEKLHQIFDPFFTTKSRGKGTGLGLTIVYQAVKAMEGIIAVKSEINKGTEFKLIFPEDKSRNLIESKIQEPTQPKVELKLKLNIFLIEDEEIIRKTFQQYFQNIGSHIDCFEDSETGLEQYLLNMNKYELVILDINLPKLSGIEVYRRIKEVCPSQQTLFITGYNEFQIPPQDEFDLGVIQKPFKFDELLNMIKTKIR